MHVAVTERIIGAAMKVHSAIGAQLANDGLKFRHQVRLPIIYQGVELESAYRIDFIVEECVVIELKAVTE